VDLGYSGASTDNVYIVREGVVIATVLNSGAIRLKRPKNMTQIGFPSLRPVKSIRLPGVRVKPLWACVDQMEPE